MQSHGDIVIAKLGGSVITRRDGTFDNENASSLAREIVGYGKPILVIHGGGTITKHVLLKYKVESDFLSSTQQAVMRCIRAAMQSLHQDLPTIFESFGLKCVSVAPHRLLTSRGGEIRCDDLNELKELLASGLNPIVCSDALEDKEGGYYACSSDQIAGQLTRILKPRVVLFLTGVDGVYGNYPPQSDRERPVPVADSGVIHHWRHNSQVGKSDMHGKLSEAVACAPFTQVCCILNGRV